jgi:mRNA interferase RelE/StbE
MPAKLFHVPKKTNKSVSKFPIPIQDKIDKAFNIIKENPLKGEKLHGELKNYYKYRVGDYRIVYQFDSKTSTVILVKVEHRQGVYR